VQVKPGVLISAEATRLSFEDAEQPLLCRQSHPKGLSSKALSSHDGKDIHVVSASKALSGHSQALDVVGSAWKALSSHYRAESDVVRA
jgi:hypothetical protein